MNDFSPQALSPSSPASAPLSGPCCHRSSHAQVHRNSRRESVVGLMALDCGTCSVAFRVHYSEPGLVGPRTLPRLCAIGESDKTKLRNVRLPAPDTRRARPPPRHADRHPGGEPATPRCQ